MDILLEGLPGEAPGPPLLGLPHVHQGALRPAVMLSPHHVLGLTDPHGAGPGLLQAEEVVLVELLVPVTVAGRVVVEPLSPQAGVGLLCN